MSTTFTCDFCKSTETFKDNEWAFGNNGHIISVELTKKNLFTKDDKLLHLGMLPPKFEDGGDVCDTCNKDYVVPLRLCCSTFIKESEKLAKGDDARADSYKSTFIANVREALRATYWAFERSLVDEDGKPLKKPRPVEEPKPMTSLLEQFRFPSPVLEDWDKLKKYKTVWHGIPPEDKA